jgi:Group II intron, maturase-specific domain
MVRGWGAYFRVGNSASKFNHVDRYVRDRLAIFLAGVVSLPAGPRRSAPHEHASDIAAAMPVTRLMSESGG